MNEYINIDLENIENEHLCCAISDPKHKNGVCAKKEWLKNQLNDGHIFRKLNVQGKVFIEYAPLEKAWVPIIGDNLLYIYCLWVAGSFKGKGYGKELLNYAINDAKKQGKNGICVLSSKKKKPFICDKSFFEKFGFVVADSVGEYELLALMFNDKNQKPQFTNLCKSQKIDNKDLTIYYSDECPFTSRCVEDVKDCCAKNNVKVNLIKVDGLEKAKNVPCVFNNWSVFLDGKHYSNVLLNANSLEKILKIN